MPKAIGFWNFLAKRYARQAIADEGAYQHKLTATRQYLSPEANVLEFGCGTGSTALLHAPYVKHLHAIDYSSKMIEIANEKLAASDLSNLTFAQQSIEELPQNGDTYDVILGLNILHLLENRQATLDKVFALLKPGGHFIASTACLDRAGRLLKIFLPLGGAIGLLPNVDFFSKGTLTRELEKAGLTLRYQWQPKNAQSVFTVVERPD